MKTFLSKRTGIYRSPARILLLLSFSVFIVEFMVMLILAWFPHESPIIHGLTDSILLLLLLAPFLYFLLFRPLLLLVNELMTTGVEMRRERDRARRYLDIAPVIFLILDKDQKVSLINRKGAETLGYSEDEISGRNWIDNFVPEIIRDELREGFRKIISGEKDFGYHENPVLTKDHGERLIAWRNTVLKGADGNVTGVLTAGEDITEENHKDEALKERLEELERFRKATVEREFRIRELKEKLAGLKREGVKDTV